MCTIGTLAAGNYSFGPFVNGALTISKAPLTVTANNASREYGDANPAFTATLSGFKNGETLATSGVTGAASCTSAATASSGASPPTYPIVCTIGTLAAGDYSFGPFVNGALTITKAPLTVTANNASREYGDANPAFTATLSGFKNGETLATSGVTGAASCTSAATASSGASPPTYPIACTIGTLAAGNDSFGPFVNGALTITKAPLTVTANNQTAQYSDPNPTLTYTISGFKNGETLATSGVTGAASCSTTRTAGSAPSPPTFPIVCTIGTLSAGNYSFPAGNFQPATFTVTREDARATYTGPMLVFTPPGGSSATIALKAAVLDATAPPALDPDAGNISNATVTFKDGATTLCTTSVILDSPSDIKVGTASCTATISGLGAHTISIFVNGYYLVR